MERNLTKSAQGVQVIHSDTGLTAQQERCALLLAAGTRITDAAQQVGTSRGTLYRWLQQQPFQCYYNQAKKDVQQVVEGSLLDLHQRALEGIRASLESQKEEVRLKASTWVVDRISQMPVGASDVRKVMKEDIAQSAPYYQSVKEEYQRALAEAGLED